MIYLNFLSGEMWLGLDKLHDLTSQASYTLQITLTDFDGEKYVAVYEQFQVRTFQALQNNNKSNICEWDNIR